MANNPIGTLIQPAGVNGGYDNKDYERASYYDTNGTISVRVTNPDGSNISGGGGGSGGTINVGTINSGTINAGTISLQPKPAINILSFGTTFGGTAAGYGTLVPAPGAGTSTNLVDLSVVNQSGTLATMVGFGTALNGTSVIVKGNFTANSGIEKAPTYPVNAGMTNTDLVCYIGAAGTIDVAVSYFVTA